MDLGISVNSSVKNSSLCTALVKERNSMDNKANWTESKKANSVKSLHTHLVEYFVPFLTHFSEQLGENRSDFTNTSLD